MRINQLNESCSWGNNKNYKKNKNNKKKKEESVGTGWDACYASCNGVYVVYPVWQLMQVPFL